MFARGSLKGRTALIAAGGSGIGKEELIVDGGQWWKYVAA